MSSPPPIDPYLILQIPRDADLSAIRSAHRKLVLRYHPDRIKDEEERAKGREEFQKVQQAYELLSDPATRSRYDDKVRLAELRNEARARELPVRSPSYPVPPFQYTAPREYRDGHYYEERVPRGAPYFDDEDGYAEEPARAPVRKGDGYDKKISGWYTDKKSTSWKAAHVSIDIALKLQKKAASAKEKVKERDLRAANAKTRDQERRRDASEKRSSRSPYVEDGSSSDSDDTATYANVNRKPAKASPAYSSPRASKTSPPRGKDHKYSDDDEDDDWGRDKHQDLHASACDYIQRSVPDRTTREIHRQDSSHSYFEPRAYARRSGSDREDRRQDRDRTKPPRSRRPSYPEAEIPRDHRSRKVPKMPTATSAPVNIKIPEERRAPMPPLRSSTMQAVRDHRKEAPSIARSNTMPAPGSARRTENVPSRGSNLKHAETHDSGYGSSSPATPDMNGTSPTKYSSATRYQVVDGDEEYSRGHRTILVNPEDANRRTRSPTRERQRPPLATSGKRPARAATSFTPHSPADFPPTRPTPVRHESMKPAAQAREPAHLPRVTSSQRDRKPLFREISSDELESSRKHRSSKEKAALPRIRTQDADHASFSHRLAREGGRDEDYYPGSNYRSELRHPGMGTRRPSVC